MPAAKRFALPSLAAGNFAIGTGALMIAGLTVTIAQSFAVTAAAAGQLISVYALTYAVTAAPLSLVTTRFCPKTIARVAMVGFLVTNAAAAAVDNFVLLLILRAASAIFAAMFTPLASAIATKLVPEDRAGAAIGIVFGGFVIATVLGAPLGAYRGGAFGWRAAFILVACLSAVGFVVIQLSLPRHIEKSPLRSTDLWGALRHWPSVAGLTTTTLQIMAQFLVFTYLAVLLSRALDADAALISAMLLIFGVASVAGNFLGAAAADRFGAKPTLIISLTGLPIALLLTATLDWGVAWTCFVMALWGVFGFSFTAPQQLYLVSLQPARRTLLLAFNASAIYLGNSIGAVLGGLLLPSVGVISLSIAAAIVASMAALWFLVTGLGERRTIRSHPH